MGALNTTHRPGAALLALPLIWLLGCSDQGPPPEAEDRASPVQPDLWPASAPPFPDAPDLEDRLAQILSIMTLEQKVGQVIQADSASVTPREVKRYRLGSVLSGGNSGPLGKPYGTAEQWLAQNDAFYEASVDPEGVEIAIPVLIGIDAVHGHNNAVRATLFPHNIALGAARDPDLILRMGRAVAIELRATGHDWTFAPTLAVPQDPRWGRTYEGFSASPDLVAAYAGAMVRGLQGAPGQDGTLGETHVIATAKHFIGDGGTQGGRDQGDTILPETVLRDIHGAGYGPAIKAGVQAVMASFSSWNGRKIHGDRGLLTDVLRQGFGFDGLVVGDWNGHSQVPGCTEESCPAAFSAGLDMFMAPDSWRGLYRNTLAQVHAGEISMARLDEAVARILRVKLRAGLFDAPKPSQRALAGGAETLGSDAHRRLAREAVRKSLVLLKNANGLLPLSPDLRVLVAGDGADDISKQAGGWTLTWQGGGLDRSAFPGATSIWDGIREAVSGGGGTAILAPDGETAGPLDVAIVVFGEDPYAETLGDRQDLSYSAGRPDDLALLRRLKARGVPVVAVFLTGRPLWTNPELNAADAFVVAWQPGSEGVGVADLLFTGPDGTRRHDFTGRLPFPWPAEPDDVPDTGVGLGGDAPLFPIGHGLGLADAGALAALPENMGTVDRTPRRTGPVLQGAALPGLWFAAARAGDGARVRLALPGDEAGGIAVTAIDTDRQEGALGVTLNHPDAVFLLAADGPQDLSRETNAALEIEITFRMEPDAPAVDIAMVGTGAPEGWLDLTAEPGTAWTTRRFSLSCLARTAGVSPGAVSALLALRSPAAPTRIELAVVRLVQDADGRETCG
ncbi:MAG: glycoside hydrolase family 3 N-terminal domain-containing protein [Alphaproteobacteria bacterium]